MVYDLFKHMLGSGPVYAALGNHDSYNQSDIVSPLWFISYTSIIEPRMRRTHLVVPLLTNLVGVS